MKGFVITLVNLPESMQAAKRCIESGKKYGTDVYYYGAIEKKYSLDLAKTEELVLRKWDTKYSDTEAVVGNFMSQYFLWKWCVESNETLLILEHDAVFTAPVPSLEFDSIISIAIPSFGTSNKVKPGVHKTFSKPSGHLPGAHAYIVKPEGAKELIKVAKEKGILPCDLFLNNEDFPYLQELSPGLVYADDTFTTIQKREGCVAKHGYSEAYKILT